MIDDDDERFSLNIFSSKDFSSKSTKVELEESHSKLSNVIFPGIAICSPNKVRRSFLLWISKNLNESGHNFLDREINGLIKKAFLGGSRKPLSKKEQNLMNILLKSSFLREYYWGFVAEMNTSTIQSDGTTIQLSNNILNGNIEDIHKDYFLKSSIPELSSQWKVFQKLVKINWQGGVLSNSSSSLVKFDPVRVTSDGVCTWLAPLAHHLKSQDWPTGVVSGENNGLKLMLDIESYDFVADEDVADLGYKVAVTNPLDIQIVQQVGISVSPGTSNQFGVSVKIMDISDKALGIKDPYSRRCYLNSELKMRFLPSTAEYHYSIYNCLFEAAMEAAQTKCRCLPASFSDSADQCEANHLKCFNDIMDRIGESQLSSAVTRVLCCEVGSPT